MVTAKCSTDNSPLHRPTSSIVSAYWRSVGIPKPHLFSECVIPLSTLVSAMFNGLKMLCLSAILSQIQLENISSALLSVIYGLARSY